MRHQRRHLPRLGHALPTTAFALTLLKTRAKRRATTDIIGEAHDLLHRINFQNFERNCLDLRSWRIGFRAGNIRRNTG